jgi:hypothetical protein
MNGIHARRSMTQEERRADDERFRKLTPLEQIRELKDLLAGVEAAIDDPERRSH